MAELCWGFPQVFETLEEASKYREFVTQVGISLSGIRSVLKRLMFMPKKCPNISPYSQSCTCSFVVPADGSFLQELKSSMPQVVTLQDLRCITAIGVVKGTSWRVPSLEETHFRFGSAAGTAGGSGRAEAGEEEAAALEELVEALRAREEAAKELQAARAVSLPAPNTCVHPLV